MDTTIKQFVKRVRARLREQSIVDQLFRAVGIGLLIATVVSLISLVVPFFYAVPVAAGVVILSFFYGLIMGIRRTPSMMEAALRADAKGHKERISTALFLEGREDAFSSLQKKDALKVIDAFLIRKEFPLHVRGRQVAAVIALALVFVVSSLIDTPARDVARNTNAVHREAQEEIAQLEKVEKELRQKKEISETEIAELTEQLEQAKKELKEADSNEDLKKAEERILKKLEMASERTENKTLSEALDRAAEERKEAAAGKQQDLAKEAQEAMEKAEHGSAKDKKDACEKLKKLAETVGDEELKEAAEQYKASDYAQSDYVSADNALSSTLEHLSNRQSDFANNNSSGQSNSRNTANNANNSNNQSGSNNRQQNGNQAGNQSNGQSGTSGQSGNSNNGANGQNPSGGQGSGNGPGSGQGNQNGGNGTGGGWNYGSKDGSEGARKTNENITVPDGEVGTDENLTGKANGNNSSTMEKSSQSRTWGGNKVSYGEVSGEYKEKAYKKVNGSNYPTKLKDKIKNYFDGLN
ncbi:MAG: hypothetical protein IJ801_08625 [Lachnospiraceae bacterium]|nr:hypothetical protein [Lachnospiraceae bacterium]